jgi:RNA polymerase sigma-70 factor (sigma-E family)
VSREHPQFQEFFAAHYPRLRRLGYWLTGDWTEAEELAQEAMVRTWWRWSIVRGHDQPQDYARKVLVNRHRSLLRRTVVRARHAARNDQPSSVAASDPTDALVLWEATRRLSARQRAVIVLRFQEDLSEAEVGRLLGLPVGTVKSTSSRALARLREQLGPAAEDLVGEVTRRADDA